MAWLLLVSEHDNAPDVIKGPMGLQGYGDFIPFEVGFFILVPLS
jgi:hypothetical protein